MDEAVQGYIDTIAPENRPLFDRLNALIMGAYPDAAVALSYGMPSYRVGGRRLYVGDERMGRRAGFPVPPRVGFWCGAPAMDESSFRCASMKETALMRQATRCSRRRVHHSIPLMPRRRRSEKNSSTMPMAVACAVRKSSSLMTICKGAI